MADHVLDHAVGGHSWVPVEGVFAKFQIQVSQGGRSIVGRVEIRRNYRGVHQRYLGALHTVVGICLDTGAGRTVARVWCCHGDWSEVGGER